MKHSKACKILVKLLLVLMVLPILAACGADPLPPADTTPAPPPQSDPPEDPAPDKQEEPVVKTPTPAEGCPLPGQYAFCSNEPDDNDMITLTGIAPYMKNTVGTLWYANPHDGGWHTRLRTENMLFVPKGTYIRCGNKCALFFYDETGKWHPEWYVGTKSASGDPAIDLVACAVPCDAYLRYTIAKADTQGNLLDSYTQAQLDAVSASMRIMVPADQINRVYVTDPYTLLSPVYTPERVATLDSYAKVVQEGSLNYIFITDLHQDAAEATAVQRQLQEINTIVKTLNGDADPTNDIDFICLGGDLSTGDFANRTVLQASLAAELAPLKECTIPVMMVRGNHDDNAYRYNQVRKSMSTDAAKQAWLDDYGFDAGDWYDFVLTNYGNDDNSAEIKTNQRVHDARFPEGKSAYYYRDFAEKKVRVICLDSIDGGALTPENNGFDRWGYSNEQLYWLINDALTAPEGYNYVFLSHTGYQADFSNLNNYRRGNYSALSGILTAFQQRKSYDSGLTVEIDSNTVAVSCDYSQTTGGKILSFQYGHHHADLASYDAALGMAALTIDTAGQFEERKGDNVRKTDTICGETAIHNAREVGTISEACFDLVVVTPTTVDEIRFGVGKDAHVELKTPDPAA